MIMARDPLVLARLAEQTADGAERDRPLFANVRTFCMFIGNPRSGHSIVGSLLDAHPRMIVAHQLNVLALLEGQFSKWQLYHLLLKNSRHYGKLGRTETGYSYAVPNQWQGRFETIEVIGDKRGGGTERILNASPEAYHRLHETIDVPVRWIHVVRNPFDNIGTFVTREGRELDAAIDLYFERCETVVGLEGRLGENELIHVRHEDLIADPSETLRRLCEFLGVDAPADYLEDCAKIVFADARQTRHGVDWPEAASARVSEEIERFAFLEGYSFDG